MTTWTNESVTALAVLWMRGVPARAIGDRLGLTPSAVIAKANRLQLAPRLTGPKTRRRLPPAERQAEEAPPSGIPFLETTPHQCRYITHEATGIFCCGEPRAYDTAWCARHCVTCFTPEGLETVRQAAAQRAAARAKAVR